MYVRICIYIYQALAVTVITISHVFRIYSSQRDPFLGLIPNKQTNYSIRKVRSDVGGEVEIDGYPIVCE